jgi:hypothetical protein
MRIRVAGEVIEWRGPAPFHFLRLPDAEAELVRSIADRVSYGWGMIPATVVLGATEFTTALWPRTGSYVVPLKDRIRAAEGVELGDVIELELLIDA